MHMLADIARLNCGLAIRHLKKDMNLNDARINVCIDGYDNHTCMLVSSRYEHWATASERTYATLRDNSQSESEDDENCDSEDDCAESVSAVEDLRLSSAAMSVCLIQTRSRQAHRSLVPCGHSTLLLVVCN